VGGKACAEGGEPDGFGGGVRGEGVLEGGEDAGAADVSVAVEDGAGFLERVVGESVFDGENDIASAGMGDKAVGGGGFFLEEPGNGLCGE
jgi:hypothetical protein